jgi:hypothetical protein
VELLVDDGFEQGFSGRVPAFQLHGEGTDGGDERAEFGIGRGEMRECRIDVIGRSAACRAWFDSHGCLIIRRGAGERLCTQFACSRSQLFHDLSHMSPMAGRSKLAELMTISHSFAPAGSSLPKHEHRALPASMAPGRCAMLMPDTAKR